MNFYIHIVIDITCFKFSSIFEISRLSILARLDLIKQLRLQKLRKGCTIFILDTLLNKICCRMLSLGVQHKQVDLIFLCRYVMPSNIAQKEPVTFSKELNISMWYYNYKFEIFIKIWRIREDPDTHIYDDNNSTKIVSSHFSIQERINLM